jgi:ribosomal protein S18 acetylase RimI-like enzyme
MEIRTFNEADADAVIDLWRATGLVHPTNEPRRDIARKVTDSPWGFLVLTEDDEIIGSVMVGYDGHRGWINYLACHPDHRRRGVATELMAAAHELLLDRGCPKINLQVRSGNDAAIGFYESIGYTDDSVTSLGLRLIPDN